MSSRSLAGALDSLSSSPGFRAVQGRRRVGVHRHGRIAQHGLRPRGGDRHVRRLAGLRIDHRIPEVPEVALDLFVEHLVVADRRLQERVPVDQPLAAIDQPLAEQVEERAAHRAGADVVQRESGPPPIAAAAHLLQLAQDAALVLFLPLPDPPDQLFAAQVVARQVLLFLQPPLDDRLRGDAGVVRARHPQRLEALHAFHADQDVLQGVVQGVPQVQRTGDVGRRDHDRERRPAAIGFGLEESLRLPPGVQPRPGFGVVEAIGERFGREGGDIACRSSMGESVFRTVSRFHDCRSPVSGETCGRPFRRGRETCAER